MSLADGFLKASQVVVLSAMLACGGESPNEPTVLLTRDVDHGASAQWSGLDVRASFDVSPYSPGTIYQPAGRHLLVELTATNGGETELEGTEAMGCLWWLRAYDNPEYAGDPVWRVENGLVGCFDRDEYVRLAPGSSLVRGAQAATVGEILGGAGPATLYFTAVLTLKRPAVRTAEFRLGPVTLNP